MTPQEINWRIKAENERKAGHDMELARLAYNVGALVRLAMSDQDWPEFNDIFGPPSEEDDGEPLTDWELRDACIECGLKLPDFV